MDRTIMEKQSYQGDFWQNLWNSFLDVVGEDEFNLFVWGTTVYIFLVYWGFGMIYTFMDLTNKPRFLRRYKIQPGKNEPVDAKQLIKVISLVLFNQIIVGIPFSIATYYAWELRGGMPDIRELPSFREMLVEIIVCILVEEFGLYYSHRVCHTKIMYKHIHKLHHSWHSPIAITAIYVHPLEHLFSNLVPISLGVFICRSHIATSWLWYTIPILSSLYAHSGYAFPILPYSYDHDFHHSKGFNYNFGSLRILDIVHGTYMKPTGGYRKNVSHLSSSSASPPRLQSHSKRK